MSSENKDKYYEEGKVEIFCLVCKRPTGVVIPEPLPGSTVSTEFITEKCICDECKKKVHSLKKPSPMLDSRRAYKRKAEYAISRMIGKSISAKQLDEVIDLVKYYLS